MYTVKQARLLANKTQEDMADILGIHVQTYRKLEHNPTEITIGQAKIIAEITGVSVNHIFFGSDSTDCREVVT